MKILVCLLCLCVIWPIDKANAESVIIERHALVIGNSNYASLTDLKNPANDAIAVGNLLERLGFDVTVLQNSVLKDMRDSLLNFTNQLNSQSVALIYYAGHGVQNEGVNYLIPSDADVQQAWQLQDESLAVNSVIRALDESRAPLRIVMLDACRDNPIRSISRLTRSGRQKGGLAQTRSTYGTILSYATQPDNVALDGSGTHSPYATALLRRLPTPNVSIGDMLNLVGNDVLEATGSLQQPWQSSSPIPKFCFQGCRTPGSSIELTGLIGDFVDKLRLGDLQALQQLVPLVGDQTSRLQNLFERYDQFEYLIGEVVQDKDRSSASVGLELVRSTSHQGNLVFPASTWSKLELVARQQGGSWSLASVDSDYLSSETASAVDIFAPDVSFESNETNATGENALVVNAVIIDNVAVEAAAVYYRDSVQKGPYRSTPLQDSGDGKSHTAILSTEFVTSGVLELYVEATDINGNRVQFPHSQQPETIKFDHADASISNRRPTARSTRPWLYVGLAVLAAGAIAAQSDDGSGGDGTGGARPVLITTPLP